MSPLLLMAAISLDLIAEPPLPGAETQAIKTFLLSQVPEAKPTVVIKHLQGRIEELERFIDPRCTMLGSSYRCALVETPRIAELRFEGQLPFGLLKLDLERRSSLRPGRQLPAVAFGKRQDPWAELRQKIGRRLARYIDEKGYADTRVDVTFEDHPRGKRWRRARLRITLGTALRWGDVVVEGLPRAEAKAIETRLKGLGGRFRQDVLRTRMEGEEENLRAEGYVEAVADTQVERDGEKMNIRITISRGPHLDLRFQGPTKIPRAALRDALTFAKARAINEDQIEASIKALKTLYQNRRYFRPTITVQDPQIAAIDVQEDELKAQIRNVRRRLWDQVNKRRAALSAIAVKRQHLRHLRRQVIAQAREARQLVFTIDPGDKFVCDGVQIAGIPRDLARELLDEKVLSTKPPKAGRHDGRLLSDELEADEARIATFLEARGYLTEKVEAQLVQRSPGRIVVRFHVRAQPPTYVRSISLVGVSDGQEDDWDDDEDEAQAGTPKEDLYSPLLKALGIAAGSPLLDNTAELLRQRALRFYRRRGYPSTTVEVKFDLNGDGAQFRLMVQEGRRVLFGGLIVSGLHRTKRQVVMTAFRGAVVGQPFNPQTFAKAAARLRSWRVFRRVRVRYLGLKSGRDQIFVDVSLEEGVSQTLDLSFGYSLEDDFQTAIQWRDRNVFGRAWSFDATGVMGLVIGRRSEIRSAFKLPRLLGPNTDLSIEPRLYYREPNRPSLWNHDQPFQLESDNDLVLKGVVKVVHRFTRFSTVAGTYTYAMDREVDDSVFTELRTGSFAIEGNWLAVDNPFNPKRGLHLKGTLKYASPYLAGDAHFISAVGHGSVYLPVGRSTIAANLRGGSLHELPDSRAIAGTDLFRLGGPRSIRGFALDSVRLFRAQDSDLGNGRDGHGTRFASTSVELRMPIGEQRADSGFGISFFSDLGWVGADDFDAPYGSTYAWSNGLSASYVLPIGPVGLVIAHQSIQPQRPDGTAAPAMEDYQLCGATPCQALTGDRIGYHIAMGYIF